jgi:hypothetical protein
MAMSPIRKKQEEPWRRDELGQGKTGSERAQGLAGKGRTSGAGGSWKSGLPAFGVALALLGGLFFLNPVQGREVARLWKESTYTVLGLLPPVFLLLGLFDSWVSRERIIPLLGEGSGIWGGVLATLLGALAAGPLYLSFPIAEVMLTKGASLRNVFVFVGAWSTMKIPMFLFELGSLGGRFAVARYAASLVGIVLIAKGTELFLGKEERRLLLARYETEE